MAFRVLFKGNIAGLNHTFAHVDHGVEEAHALRTSQVGKRQVGFLQQSLVE